MTREEMNHAVMMRDLGSMEVKLAVMNGDAERAYDITRKLCAYMRAVADLFYLEHVLPTVLSNPSNTTH